MSTGKVLQSLSSVKGGDSTKRPSPFQCLYWISIDKTKLQRYQHSIQVSIIFFLRKGVSNFVSLIPTGGAMMWGQKVKAEKEKILKKCVASLRCHQVPQLYHQVPHTLPWYSLVFPEAFYKSRSGPICGSLNFLMIPLTSPSNTLDIFTDLPERGMPPAEKSAGPSLLYCTCTI